MLGRRLGNKGIAWGLLLGTLPDLDVLAYRWLDGVGQLAWHRGLSHSLLFCVIGAPLFTLPMLGAMLVAPWFDRGARARLRLMAVGAGLSTLYTLASFGLEALADASFDSALERDGVVARRWMSAPMPMTTLYWRCLVDEGDQFRIGHVAILDPDGEVAWRVVPRRGDLVAAFSETRALDALDGVIGAVSAVFGFFGIDTSFVEALPTWRRSSPGSSSRTCSSLREVTGRPPATPAQRGGSRRAVHPGHG